MHYTAEYACISHPGKVRRNNQDNFILLGKHMQPDNAGSGGVHTGTIRSDMLPALLGVFDGMGGEERGEMAAYIAAHTAAGYRLTGRDFDDLKQLCRRANAAICDYAGKNGIQSTGTTADLMLLGREKVCVANLGDSRIYLVDASGIRQLSQDHVMPAPAGHKPPLLQYLGIPEHEMRLEPNIIERPAAQGETYLMCSDGLTDMVPVDKIESTIRGAFSLPQAAQQLLDRALGAGGRDNITLVLCQIHISHGGLRGLLDHVFG